VHDSLRSQQSPVSREPKLLDQVRETIRRSTTAFLLKVLMWLDQALYLLSSKARPGGNERPEIEQFLNYLAVQKQVVASTQNQPAQCTGVFYHEVLYKDRGVGSPLDQ
jgi:Phage integrase, N-terminal SAM-like domain